MPRISKPSCRFSSAQPVLPVAFLLLHSVAIKELFQLWAPQGSEAKGRRLILAAQSMCFPSCVYCPGAESGFLSYVPSGAGEVEVGGYQQPVQKSVP